jgi:hypothetical protein
VHELQPINAELQQENHKLKQRDGANRAVAERRRISRSICGVRRRCCFEQRIAGDLALDIADDAAEIGQRRRKAITFVR